MEWLKAYPVFEGVVLVVFVIVVWALKKQFASKDELNEQDKRLQTVEQTYVKGGELAKINNTVKRIEVEIKDLPKDVSDLAKEVAKLQSETKHLHDILKRIEHPLNLIVESKLLGKE